MKRLKNITILLCFLSLLAFISCSAEDKMGGGETENTETIEIESKDFPTDLFGTYRDENVALKYSQERHNTLVRKITNGEGTEVIIIKGMWIKDINTGVDTGELRIEKWTKTTKGGKTIKLEGKDSSVKKATITYDYASGTLSGTFKDGAGATYLFNGKRIGDLPAIFQ